MSYGEPKTFDPEYKGPISKRSCTDIICLGLFLAFIAGWVVVAIFAYKTGDPERLLLPTNSKGQVCGKDKGVENRPYLFYFDMTKCLPSDVTNIGCRTPQVCVHNCPNTTFSNFFEPDSRNLICLEDVDLNKEPYLHMKSVDLINMGYCAAYYIKSNPVLGRCIPNLTDFTEIQINEFGQQLKISAADLATGRDVLAALLNARDFGEKVFEDLKITWGWIILGFVIAMVVSLIWIMLMRYFAGVMVWISIFGVIAILAAGCAVCFWKWWDLKDVQGSDAEIHFTTKLDSYLSLRITWLVFGIGIGVVLLILLLMLLFLRSRIVLSVILIQESSKAVSSMTSTFFFPIVPFLLQLAALAFAGSVAIYIASSGTAKYVVKMDPNCSNACPQYFNKSVSCDPDTFSDDCCLHHNVSMNVSCQFKSYEGDSNLYRAHLYNLFGLLWAEFFLVGMGQITLAGAFASWYWTFHKKDVHFFVLTRSFFRTCRYHLGSIAFGSLLLAIVRFIRIMLEFLDRQIKKYHESAIAKCILCCLKCCFYCLEKFIKFINRNAYIMIAVYGKNFCYSAREAFMLLMRNIIRVFVLDKVTDFLLFIGKLVVVGGVGVLSFFFFSNKIPGAGDIVPTTNYYFVPVVIIVFGSYVIASGFFSVYEMAVDTIFLCFLEDCERNDGSVDRPYYMSKDLMKILGKKRNKTE